MNVGMKGAVKGKNSSDVTTEVDWDELASRPERRARRIALGLTLALCAVAAIILLPFFGLSALFVGKKAPAEHEEEKDEPRSPVSIPEGEIEMDSPTVSADSDRDSDRVRSRGEILDRFGFGFGFGAREQ